jgi:hypothetical protein
MQEITRHDVSSTKRRKVIRLRDTVLPIVDPHSIVLRQKSQIDLATMTA